MKYDAPIAQSIVYAQIASDGGKRIESELLSSARARGVWHKGYAVKDKYIYKAINLINKSNGSIFHYHIVESPDQNGCDSIIVYFEWRWEGKRYQVSFHTPRSKWSGVLPKKSPFRTEWTEKFTSRENAIILQKEVIPML